MRNMHLLAVLAIVGASAPLAAWEPFRSENDHVADGNERMRANDPQGALEDYDQAARELPNDAGVHLNRGLALLATGDLPRAREALLLATEPPAGYDLRADAYYDLGLAFYREGTTAAEAQNHEEAQRAFREAADAFRRSLRLRPGHENAGWNLELALRRLREQEEQQQQQEQQEQQEQQQQEQQNQDSQNQDSQNQDSQNQDSQNQDSQNQDSQNQDAQNQDAQNQDSQDQENSAQNDRESNAQRDGEQEDQAGSQDSQPQQAPTEPSPRGTLDGLPPEHRGVLDALEQNEDNFERQRARMRAAQENRRPEYDW